MTRPECSPSDFGRYRVLSKLGSGAMGDVLLARDSLLDRDVALKTLAAHCLPDPEGRRPAEERFLMEARAVAAIDHPNVVRLFDAGRADGVPFLVMEAVKGKPLAARLDDGLLSASEVRALGVQIARALEAAHARGIVHRDVKPSNILESEAGVWKLADFGIARLPYSSITHTGCFLGTPAYAAPESLLRGTFTSASDIYGLGATLYEALCGTPPHGLAGGRTMLARVGGPIALPRTILGQVPAELETAIMAALASDPATRPDAAGLVDLLVSTRWERRPAPKRKRLLAGTVIAATALAALLAGGGDPQGNPAAASPAVPSPALARPAAGLATPVVADPEMDFPPEPVPSSEMAEQARSAYVAGNLYFARQWWSAGFTAYRAAIAADPGYRRDPIVIRNAIKCLMSPSQSWRASRFLADEIGQPAIPYLREALSSSSLNTRRAAARLLRELDRPDAMW